MYQKIQFVLRDTMGVGKVRQSALFHQIKQYVFRIIKWALILFFGSSIFFTLLYRFVPPPFTPLMLIRAVENMTSGKRPVINKEWKSLSEISPNLVLAVIASEDNNFENHFGIDLKAIEKAQKLNEKGRKIRGASTISQQTAKNAFLWPARNYLRKGLELYFTGLIELVWGKKRIMEVYLNIIEMGDGIYGAEAASQYYFHKAAKNLTRDEAASIATVLPNPRKWRPDRPTAYTSKIKARTLWNMNNVEKPDW